MFIKKINKMLVVAIVISVIGSSAVINLSNDTGTAWITVNMRNSNNELRGQTVVQRGKRAEFGNWASAGYIYRLGMKKTNNTGGGAVTIRGSWSPDRE